jgi:hypothetical protein
MLAPIRPTPTNPTFSAIAQFLSSFPPARRANPCGNSGGEIDKKLNHPRAEGNWAVSLSKPLVKHRSGQVADLKVLRILGSRRTIQTGPHRRSSPAARAKMPLKHPN